MNIEELVNELEKIKEMFIHLKNYGWINDIKRDIEVDKAIESIETLLTAYENEKDESKEYQIGFAQGCYEKDLDWQDKIKEKIEEVDIQLQKLKDGLTGRNTNFVNKNMLFAQKKVLQSLLEKE